MDYIARIILENVWWKDFKRTIYYVMDNAPYHSIVVNKAGALLTNISNENE